MPRPTKWVYWSSGKEGESIAANDLHADAGPSFRQRLLLELFPIKWNHVIDKKVW
jgi:hypothetical protein